MLAHVNFTAKLGIKIKSFPKHHLPTSPCKSKTHCDHKHLPIILDKQAKFIDFFQIELRESGPSNKYTLAVNFYKISAEHLMNHSKIKENFFAPMTYSVV